MIQANELRIGNYVYAFGVLLQVLPEHILNLYQIEVVKKVCIDLTPIPLTEDWLIKFGINLGVWFYDDSFLISKKDDDTYQIYVQNAPQTQRICFAEFKYVHQLQNLYFALTGKELTFKL